MDKNLLWLDLEMTGLEMEKNRIIEFAIVITDIQLNILDKFSACIKVEQKFLDSMDTWNFETHTKSGLLEDIKKSGKILQEVEQKALYLLDRYFKNQNIFLTGSTLGLDRLFLDKYMPKFAKKTSLQSY